MTFSYTPFASDKDRVRFHMQDVDASAAVFSDEEITAAITEFETWQAATVQLISAVLMRLTAAGDFTADWLKVDNAEARKMYAALLAAKKAEFGLEDVTAGAIYDIDAVTVTRSDNLQPGTEDTA
jgi:hypothetical protein